MIKFFTDPTNLGRLIVAYKKRSMVMTEYAKHISELYQLTTNDPLRSIRDKKQNDDKFSAVYIDYSQYLCFLKIILQRVKEEYTMLVDLNKVTMQLTTEHAKDQTPFSEQETNILKKEYRIIEVLKLDFESFIVFARILMDKVGVLISHFIKLPAGIVLPESFTDHKKYFVNKNQSLHPTYSKFLKEETKWYDQSLSFARDKMISHSRVPIGGLKVSSITGEISYIKMPATYAISEENRKKLIDMKRKYEMVYPDFKKVMDNEWEMLRYLFQESISIDEEDFRELGNIVKSSGGYIDVINIAKNLKDFLENIVRIFG